MEIIRFVSTVDKIRNSYPVRNSVMTKFKLLLLLYVRLHRNMLCMQIFNFFMEKRGNMLALKYFREKHNVLTFLNQTVLFCFIEPKWKFALQLNPGWIHILLNSLLDDFSLEAKRKSGSKETPNQSYPVPLSTSNKMNRSPEPAHPILQCRWWSWRGHWLYLIFVLGFLFMEYKRNEGHSNQSSIMLQRNVCIINTRKDNAVKYFASYRKWPFSTWSFSLNRCHISPYFPPVIPVGYKTF